MTYDNRPNDHQTSNSDPVTFRCPASEVYMMIIVGREQPEILRKLSRCTDAWKSIISMAQKGSTVVVTSHGADDDEFVARFYRDIKARRN